MKLKYIVSALVVCVLAAGSADATVKKAKKSKKENFKLIEAYTQKIAPGTQQAPPPTGEHFIIVWKAASYPETFYWRGKNGFMMCSIQKTHKISKAEAKNFPPGMVYTSQNVTGDQIHKGDTLEIIPVARGKVRIPDEIPQNATNTLFYKTGGSGWLLFPVKNIAKKSDISMQ